MLAEWWTSRVDVAMRRETPWKVLVSVRVIGQVCSGVVLCRGGKAYERMNPISQGNGGRCWVETTKVAWKQEGYGGCSEPNRLAGSALIRL